MKIVLTSFSEMPLCAYFTYNSLHFYSRSLSVLSRSQGGILGVNFKFENEMFNSELTLPYFNKKKTAYFFVKLSLAFYLCPNSLLCIPLHMYKWTLNLTSSPWDESTFSLGSAWKSFSEEYTSCAGLAVNL